MQAWYMMPSIAREQTATQSVYNLKLNKVILMPRVTKILNEELYENTRCTISNDLSLAKCQI